MGRWEGEGRLALERRGRVLGHFGVGLELRRTLGEHVVGHEDHLAGVHRELTLDHVVPRRLNGPNAWDNLVCCCVACNSKKGGRTPKQAHMKLIRPPIQPKRNPVINIRLGQDKYACWQTFLDNAYWSVELR